MSPSRMAEGDLADALLKVMVQRLADAALLKARAKVRTDSTHVLAVVRTLNRPELVTYRITGGTSPTLSPSATSSSNVGPSEAASPSTTASASATGLPIGTPSATAAGCSATYSLTNRGPWADVRSAESPVSRPAGAGECCVGAWEVPRSAACPS